MIDCLPLFHTETLMHMLEDVKRVASSTTNDNLTVLAAKVVIAEIEQELRRRYEV